jgi:two-component system chemotaxis sensor kinase CheA
MFGPPAMAAFAHELENAFEKVRQDHAPVTPALVSLLLQSADQIRKLLFEADGDHSAESERLAKALVAEVDGAPVAAAASAPVAAAPAVPASPLSRRWRIWSARRSPSAPIRSPSSTSCAISARSR